VKEESSPVVQVLKSPIRKEEGEPVGKEERYNHASQYINEVQYI
jgi:hypothetical protein